MSAVRQQPGPTRQAVPSARRGGSGQRSGQPAAVDRSRATAPVTRAYPGRRIGPVPLGPLVAWQVGIGLLVAGIAYQSSSVIPLIIGIVVLLAVAVLTLLWFNGRPLWRWVGVWSAHRARNGNARAGAPHDPALAPIREWLPKFEITSVAGRRGSADVGVIHDGTGYVFLLGPSQEDLISSADPVTVPLKALAALGDAEGVRLTAAQLLVRTLPAPSPSLGQYGQQVAQSYLEINSAGAPATVAWWIAVRLEPGWGGSSLTLDGDDIDAVRRAVRTSIGWATKVLSSEGVPCRALNETEVREVLSLTLSIDPHYVPASVRTRRTSENWRGWACDGVAHTTGWVRSWPRAGLTGASRLLAAMAALPVATTASLTFSWSPENLLRCSSFVRIGADNPRNARAAFRQLTKLASRGRVTVNRLDGEHVPGVLATIPLGIGAR